MSSVVVSTGCRLHFGLVSHGRTDAPNYGGCGLMLAEPGFEVTVGPSETDADRLDVPNAFRERVTAVLRRLRESLRCDPLTLSMRRVIPLHAGLGGGTQLALAVAAGVTKFVGTDGDPVQMARRVGRGRRSAIGVHGFGRGGFLVDGGKREVETIGELATRITVPDDWRIVLFTPRLVTGLHADDEREAFARLPPTPTPVAERLRRMIYESLLPAVARGDFDGFSEAVHDYGHAVGETFAPVQGAVFSHPRTEQLVRDLRRLGCPGVGQTSWGPTVFAFRPSEVSAVQLVIDARHAGAIDDVDVRITAPQNVGATVTTD